MVASGGNGGSVAVPDPPVPFEPLTHALGAGTIVHRVHGARFAANEFNPGDASTLGSTRFAHFLRAGTNDPAGTVPVLYAAQTQESAVAESVMHDVPLSGGSLMARNYVSRIHSTLRVTQEVKLAKFMGDGLQRLGVRSHHLTATDSDVYDRTVLWAQAAHSEGFDGLAWMSARDTTAAAYIFFGDRVEARNLVIVPGGGLGPFGTSGPAFEWLAEYCQRVNVELYNQ